MLRMDSLGQAVKRLCTTLTFITKTKTSPAKKRIYVPKKNSHVEKVNEYLRASASRVKPEELMPRFKNCLSHTPESLICVDSDVAGEIADAVSATVMAGTLHSVPIIEMGPGPGLVSRQLLNRGATKLRLYEPLPKPFFQLQQWADKIHTNRKRIRVFSYDLHNLAKTLYLDQKIGANEMEKIMHDVTNKNFAGSCVVLGICPHKKFLKLISYMAAHDVGFPHYCNTEYFIVMHPYNYLRMTSSPENDYYRYRYRSVVVQLFYDITLLKKLDRKAFLSWEKPYTYKPGDKQGELFSRDQDYLYLVHLSPKPLINELSLLQKQQLWYFLKFHMVRRRGKVINSLSRWIPIDASRLEHLNITSKTEIGQLYPFQLLRLFQEFTSWPEFNDCAFNTSMEMSLLRSNMDIDYPLGRHGKSEVSTIRTLS